LIYSLVALIIYLFMLMILKDFLQNMQLRKYNRKKRKYKNIFLEYGAKVQEKFGIDIETNNDISDVKQHLNKDGIDEAVIDAAIEIIQEFSGKQKKEIIRLAEKLEIVDYIYEEYMVSKNQYEKKYYIYLLGQLKSKKYIKSIFNDINSTEDTEKTIVGFLSALSIVEENIYDIYNDDVKDYINIIFLIINRLEKNNKIGLRRVMSYFLSTSHCFFAYMSKNEEIFSLFYKRFKVEVSNLYSRGILIYILALNHENRVNDLICSDIKKYYKKSQNKKASEEEEEYLIRLIKALGELQYPGTDTELQKLLKSKNWVHRSLAVTYMREYDEKIPTIYNMLFDKNWWVRYNAAQSLIHNYEFGAEYLLKALSEKDKYAREISSFFLGESIFLEKYMQNDIENKKQYEENIINSINSGKNISILNNILLSETIKSGTKKYIITRIEKDILEKYYENYIKKIDLSLLEVIGHRLNKRKG